MSFIFSSVSTRTTCILLGGASFYNVNLVKLVHESDRFLFPSTFQQSSIRFSCATSKSVWVDLMTSMYFSGSVNDASLGTCNWNLVSIWWRKMKFHWIGQKSSELLRHLLILQVETLPYRHEILRWDSLSKRWIPVSEWVLGIRSLFLMFLLNHLPQEIQIIHLFWVIKTSFAFSLLGYISQFFKISNQNIFLPNSPPPAIKAHPKKDSWQHLLSKLMNSCFVSLEVWEISNYCAKWNNGSFEWFPKSSFILRFPVCQEVLDISQTATAFHGIWPPLFIQSRLQ